MLLKELILKAEIQKNLAYEKYEKSNNSLTKTMQYYMDVSNAFVELLEGLKKFDNDKNR